MIHKRYAGFTVVELIVVIVVIGVLAAVTIVAYNGATRQAQETTLKSDLRQAATGLAADNNTSDSKGFPSSLPAHLDSSDGKKYQFTYTSGTPRTFCLSIASTKYPEMVFHIDRDNTIESGYCVGHGAVAVTPTDCFVFNPSTGAITNYYNYQGNNGSRPACPRDVVIPRVMGGTSVTTIGSSAFSSRMLKTVVIPDTVTKIEGSAFDSNHLTSVSLPNSLVDIYYDAFYSNQLTSVVIPRSVKEIGAAAFQVNQITTVRVPNTTQLHGPAFDENVSIVRY